MPVTYRGIALAHAAHSSTIFWCPTATADQRAALDRMQQEDRDAHMLAFPDSYRRTPRAMRVRYWMVAETADGSLCTPGTKFVNHLWAVSDNAPNNEKLFGAAHITKHRVLNSGVPDSTDQCIIGAAGMRFHGDYVRRVSGQPVKSGTPAEWMKKGNEQLHDVIDTVAAFMEGSDSIIVQTVSITVRADRSVSVPGYPPLTLPPIIAAVPIAKAVTKRRGKKNKAADADDEEEEEEKKEQPRSKKARTGKATAAAASSGPSPRQPRNRRGARAQPTESAAAEDSETVAGSEMTDEHSEAESVQGSSASVATGPPSPASRSSRARTPTMEPIVEEGAEEEWHECKVVQKAPTEAASSMSVPAPASPIASAEASVADSSTCAECDGADVQDQSDAPFASSMASSYSSSSTLSSSSSLLPLILSDGECREQELTTETRVAVRSVTLQSCIDDEQEELRQMQMRGDTMGWGAEYASAAALFDRSSSPLSFDASSFASVSCVSPMSQHLLSTRASNGFSDDDCRSSMDDEEEQSSQSEEIGVWQLINEPAHGMAEDEEESQWSAFQSNSVAQRIPFLNDEFQSVC